MERIPRREQIKQRRVANSEVIQKASHDPIMAKIMKDMSMIHGKPKLHHIIKKNKIPVSYTHLTLPTTPYV